MQELKNYFEKLNTQNWEKFEDFYELSCPGDAILYETFNIAISEIQNHCYILTFTITKLGKISKISLGTIQNKGCYYDHIFVNVSLIWYLNE